jgi:hypothetical protein
MPTFGDPNMVGYRQSPVETAKPWLPGAAAGAVGARLAYTAARPNVSGRIKRADSAVTGIEDKIKNEMRYKKPRADLLASHRLELGRAQNAAARTRKIVAARHTPKLRMMRGGAGAALLAGGAALTGRQVLRRRPQPEPPVIGGP